MRACVGLHMSVKICTAGYPKADGALQRKASECRVLFHCRTWFFDTLG